MVRSDLNYCDVMSRRQPQYRLGDPDVVIQITDGTQDSIASTENCRDHFLRRCLSVTACNRDHWNIILASPNICKLAEGMCGVLYNEQRPRTPPLVIRAPVDYRAPCSTVKRCVDECVSIKSFSTDGEIQLICPQ